MDNGESPHDDNGKTLPEDLSRPDDSSSNGSMFSRNLELKATPARRSEQPAQQPQSNMEDGDRKVYFKIEAGKIMDILKEEFERLDQMQSLPGLVEDLYAGWYTLWGDDERSPVNDFTGMFEVACQALSSAGRLERKLDRQERETLDRLLKAMAGIASGQEEQSFLLGCRQAQRDCFRMSQALNPPAETPAGPEQTQPEPGKVEDISSSVDEWFTQVSSLVVEPAGEERASAELQEGFQPQEPAIGGQQAGPVRAEIDETFPAPEDSLPDDFAETAPESGAQAGEEPPGLEEKAERKEEPEMEEPDLFADIEPRPDAAVEEAVGESSAEIPVESFVSGEKISPEQEPEEIDSQQESLAGADELVSLYFSEQCRDIIELIRHNLARLSSPSAARTSRILSRQLEQIVGLSEDFGYEAYNDSLVRMRELLTGLALAGNGENVSLRDHMEKLQAVVAELERELSP